MKLASCFTYDMLAFSSKFHSILTPNFVRNYRQPPGTLDQLWLLESLSNAAANQVNSSLHNVGGIRALELLRKAEAFAQLPAGDQVARGRITRGLGACQSGLSPPPAILFGGYSGGESALKVPDDFSLKRFITPPAPRTTIRIQNE